MSIYTTAESGLFVIKSPKARAADKFADKIKDPVKAFLVKSPLFLVRGR